MISIHKLLILSGILMMIAGCSDEQFPPPNEEKQEHLENKEEKYDVPRDKDPEWRKEDLMDEDEKEIEKG